MRRGGGGVRGSTCWMADRVFVDPRPEALSGSRLHFQMEAEARGSCVNMQEGQAGNALHARSEQEAILWDANSQRITSAVKTCSQNTSTPPCRG